MIETIFQYRILRELGHGAMGVVYLAEDTVLGRRVAIKTGSKNHGRFLREARAASALSHEHIAVVHDYGKTNDGQPYIVMEYVEGQTLADVLMKKTLTVSKALRVIRQVAEGLAEAHRHGIVHRDIKPSNIAVNERGTVKVLDFGLAKQMGVQPAEATAGQLQSEANTETREGVIVGTPMYFSPEQALGLEIDARSDLFSLGAVLYECLVGCPAFPGKTPMEICAKVIRDDPVRPSEINASISDALDRVTLKALAKSPDDRYQSADELIADLRMLETGSWSRGSDNFSLEKTQSLSRQRGYRTSRTSVIVPLLILALAVIAASGWLLLRRDKQKLQPQIEQVRLAISGNVAEASLSPDGKYVAYVNDEAGKQSILVRQINTGVDLKIVPATAARYKGISFFPDGDYVAYLKTEGDSADLYQVSTFGGASRRLASHVDTPVSFSPDGKQCTYVRYSRDTHVTDLIIADVSGNNEKILATLKQPQLFSYGGFYSSGPAWSPDGMLIAIPAYNVSDTTYREVILVNVRDGSMNTINRGRWNVIEKVVWLANSSGFLMNATEARSSVLQVWLIDRGGGEPRRITKDPSNYIGLSATKDSRILLTTKTERASSIWIQTNGSNGLSPIPSSRYLGTHGISWTTDGKFVLTSNVNGKYGIWIMDADGSNRKQLTFNDRSNLEPVISPNGQFVVYASFEGRHPHLWRIDADGGNAKQLTDGGDEDLPRFTPDGKWIVYHSINQAKYNIRKVSIDGGQPVVLINEPATQPDVSPDGKFVACFAQPAGSKTWKIIVVPIEGGRATATFDLPPTVEPEWPGLRWTPDGTALTYVDTVEGVSNVWRQSLTGGEAKPLTDFKESRIFFFDWSPNDRKLVLVRGNDTRDLMLQGFTS